MKLRHAGPEDTEAICALLADVFDENPKSDSAVLRWQYWDNPFGPASSWVCEDGGQIVGHLALIPIPLMIEGVPALGALAVDAAVKVSHRQKGIYEKLALAANADFCRRGIRVQFATRILRHMIPSTVTRTSALAGRLALYVLPLDHRWVAERLHLPAGIARVIVGAAFRTRGGAIGSEVTRPPAGLDELWSQLEPLTPYGVVRNESWWEWRYAQHPRSPYRYFEARDGDRLRAAAAVTVRHALGGRFFYILELLAADESAGRAVVAAMCGTTAECTGIAALALPGSVPSSLLRATGFRRLPRRLEVNPVELHIRDLCSTSPSDLASHPWAISWSEFDHL